MLHPERAFGCVRLMLVTAALASVTAFRAEGAPRPQDSAEAIPPVETELPADEQLRLAQKLAPILVFHPLEDYFPVSPLFPIESSGPDEGTPGADHDPLSLLGSAESRRARYRALTLEQKAELATVYYRAYPVRLDSEERIVVEFWIYYVQNDYRVRGNAFPFWVDSSHPNDLEHIHIVLRPSVDSEFVLDEVYTSSHEGTMPANRYRYGDGDAQKRGRFLVERGSHALAPDIDEDGVFTPGSDGDSGHKILWGIRDRGLIWNRYQRSFMDDRHTESERVFEYGGEAPGAGRLTYRLVPVERLAVAFKSLNLTSKQRKEIFEIDRHWFKRMFGGDNGSSKKLLVPPAREAASGSIGIGKFASTERGFLVGPSFKTDRQGVLLGARYSFLHGIRYLPDVVFEADGHLTTLTRPYLSAEALLSYPIDGTVKVLFGRALVTDSLTFERRQWDWITGVEIRFGRMRVNLATRSWGPISQSSKEYSLTYFF